MESLSQSPDAHRRPVWRLHRTTWFMLLVVAGLIVLANWPTSYVDMRTYQMGYPITGMSGDSLDVFKMADSRYGGLPWRWYFSYGYPEIAASPRTEPLIRWSSRALIADTAVAACLLCLAGVWCEWHCRQRRGWLQIMLGDLLVLTILTALPFAWWRHEHTRYRRQQAILDGVCFRGHETSLRYPSWLGKFFPANRLNFLTTVSQVSLLSPTSETLRELSCFRELETLVLRQGDYTSSDLRILRELPLLRSLQVSGGEVGLAALQDLGHVHGLQLLSLRDLRVTDEHLPRLLELGDLRTLDLVNTQITDQGLKHLGAIQRLSTLMLPGDRLTGSGLVYLHGHPWLENLYLAAEQGERRRQTPGPPLREIDLRDLPRLTTLQFPGSLDRFELHNVPLLKDLPSQTGVNSWGYRYQFPIDAERVVLSGLDSLQSLTLNGHRVRRLDLRSVPQLASLELVPGRFPPDFRESSEEPRMRISSEIMRAIGRVRSLRRLTITNADFADARLLALTDLALLRELYLAGASIGDAAVEECIAKLRLTHLDISRTRVTDAGWSRMVHPALLRSVDLSHTGITRLHLRSLPNLKKLTIDGLALEALWLEDLPLLESGAGFRLNGMPLQHVRLVNLPAVEGMSLRDLPAERLELSRLNALYLLDLSGTRADDALLASLGDCPNLYSLNLTATDVTDEGMAIVARFANLSSLDLENTCVSDVGLAQLTRLQKLNRLNLTGTVISDEALRCIVPNQGMELLYLGRTDVRGPGLKYLAALPALYKLSLGETGVTTASLADLPRLTGLVWLRLSDTNADDRGLDLVARLPRLRTLLANGCPITDQGLRALAGMRNLRELDVQDTQVTDAGIRELRGQRWINIVHEEEGTKK